MIRQIACGAKRPSLSVALRLSAATGMSVEALLGEENMWPPEARLREIDPVPTAESIARTRYLQACNEMGLDPNNPRSSAVIAGQLDLGFDQDEAHTG